MLFLQNANLNLSFFQRLLCPQCLCGIWFRCLQQFKPCVATIQLFKAGMSQTYTKAELLCSPQEWFHPYICVLSLFSLDTIHLPLDQGDNCILKVLWMFKPIFKPINHHVNKASLGEKNSVSTEGTNRGQLQTVAVRSCVNKLGTKRELKLHTSCNQAWLTKSPVLSFHLICCWPDTDKNHLPPHHRHQWHKPLMFYLLLIPETLLLAWAFTLSSINRNIRIRIRLNGHVHTCKQFNYIWLDLLDLLTCRAKTNTQWD